MSNTPTVTTGDIEKEINKYLRHPKVRELYDVYRSIDNNGYPSVNYIGFNFDSQGICSAKFYYNFYKRFSEIEILKFLPASDDFLRYYHLWEQSPIKSLDHTGCTFEVKFKPDLEPILGFHYRLKPCAEAYELIGYPKHLPFDVKELSMFPGINYEYAKNKILRKSYYYLDGEDQKKYFAKRFEHPFIEKCYCIEYTESNEFAKVIPWRFDHTKENLERPNVFSSYGNMVIQYMKDTYGLFNIVDGIYEHSDIRASYYMANNVDDGCKYPYEHELNRSFDTLKLLLK